MSQGCQGMEPSIPILGTRAWLPWQHIHFLTVFLLPIFLWKTDVEHFAHSITLAFFASWCPEWCLNCPLESSLAPSLICPLYPGKASLTCLISVWEGALKKRAEKTVSLATTHHSSLFVSFLFLTGWQG